MIDLHMHLLPGLDDGPPGTAESLEMCRLAISRGMKTVVATPHMFNGVYNVSREDILEGVSKLRRRLEEERLDLDVLPGADVHSHIDICRFIEEGKVMTLGDGGHYLLLELPSGVIPRGLDRYLFTIRLAGITPIITHPERNFEIQSDPWRIARTVSTGVLLQITADSLTGAFGSRPQRCALKLLGAGMAHLVASDAHSTVYRSPGLEKAYQVVKRTLGEAEADEVFHHRPARILAGETVEVPEIRLRQRFGFLKKWGMQKFPWSKSRWSKEQA